MELGKARGVAPAGSPFDQQLHKEYIDLSVAEYDEADYLDSDTFAARAIAAASGNSPQPEAVDARRLPAGAVGDLSAACAKLVAALSNGAAAKVAKPAARAQAMFECWMQEQEENFQPEHIAACRGAFEAAMAEVEAALAPKPMAAKPAPAPAPQPMAMPGPFVVYFDFNSADLTAVAKSVISTAATAVSKAKSSTVAIVGYTDRAGDAAYNMALAQRRAEAVEKALKAAGVETKIKVVVASLGETQPQVPTDDGVREAKNRRVTIDLK